MRRNFRVLETFRFIAAIFVALGHLFFWNQNFNTIPRSFILSVEFFFVLSGFILTLKLEKETLRVDNNKAINTLYNFNYFLSYCFCKTFISSKDKFI